MKRLLIDVARYTAGMSGMRVRLRAMDARPALAIAAMILISPVASQQPERRGSDTKDRRPATDIQRLMEAEEAAKRGAEQRRQACETWIANYQARCLRAMNPYKSQECAGFKDYIRRYCDGESKR